MAGSQRTNAVVAIVGPTGIGKTALAVALAATLPVEVVNADSRQIYRGMDIGTAKPSPQERAAVRHHLLDVVAPDDPLTLAQYQALASSTIDEIHKRGKIAFMVGGTGQYVTAVLEGWRAPEVPPNEALRVELEAYAMANGPLALFERLRAFDPDAAQQMDPYNLRRTIRALEVCIETGQPFSAQRRKERPPYSTLELGLDIEREALYRRLDARIERMMAEGLLDEVRALNAHGYDWHLPSMSALGYAQLGSYLRGECNLDEAVSAIKRDTRSFVRRQYTWFRRHGSPHWLETPQPEIARRLIEDWLAGLRGDR